VISDSKCSGITLGKDRKTGHNVWSKDPSKDGAIHYTEVIDRALVIGWSREKIGSHIVRNNTIFNCEQTGICGSLGAVFSQITSNHIYNIWAKRQFTGAEMAGIKLHAAIDVLIQNNRIHHAGRGMWMDWMAQGTRISRNLCYENTTDDLFVEVDHGPFLVDNNLFLSPTSLSDMSEGGAYVHNLFTGRISSWPELSRSTPYHLAHATAVAGLTNIHGGDNRFYNNMFVGNGEPQSENAPAGRASGFGLWVYDSREYPMHTGGNVYYDGAQPYAKESDAALMSGSRCQVRLSEQDRAAYVNLVLPGRSAETKTTLVTTELLGKARISGTAYENPDASPLAVNVDYFGKKRSTQHPQPGPFEDLDDGEARFRVW
jgi:hypothetical protein